MNLTFTPYDQTTVKRLRNGGPDAYGTPAEVTISDGGGNPCRFCLHEIPRGAPMLVCAGRPFAKPQPYAETGPIFLCADDCDAYAGSGLPPVLQTSPDYLLKAYGHDERIIYGTGRITPSQDIETYAANLLSRADVAYVDVRSSRNNCFQTRIIENE